MKPAFWDFSKKIRRPNPVFRCKADPFHRLLEEIKSRFFSPPSLLKMRIMNMHTYVCLPGSLSFCLFVLCLCVSSAAPGTKCSPQQSRRAPLEMELWAFLRSLAVPRSLMTIWWPRQWQLLGDRQPRRWGRARAD